MSDRGSEDRDALAAIRSSRLLPVLRVPSADEAVAVAGRLAAAGLGAVEFTATTDGWPAAVRAARRDWPGVVVGVGTVVTAEAAEQAVAAGAEFLVSPYPAAAVRAVADAAGLPFVEGGFTPAELAAASGRGVAKLFPAHLGGPAYLRSLLAVLPGARVVPTGGISLAEVGEWLDAGAFAVGVGSDLTAPGDLEERVRAALSSREAAASRTEESRGPLEGGARV